ncbi:ATP-binding cassette domain-containing protein [Paucilactobacillus wasatchensis]|nr:ATP-binding cassette domain-containing protein [Paucilactobacillus wasatchensis]
MKLAVQARHEKAARIRRGNHKMGQVELTKTKSAREENAGKMERGAHALQKRAHKQNDVTKPFQGSSVKLMASDFPVFTGKTVAHVDHLDLSRNGKKLLQQVTFQIKPGERIALVGPNGIGKTTLIKAMLNGQMHTQLSQHARVVYFNQDITKLPKAKSVWAFIQQASVLDDVRSRQIMGAFGINQVFYSRLIGELSGGEQVKLQLLSILLSSSNFLILDEPTNFLDRQALTALADYLINYPGTVLLVSHDLTFRTQVVTRTLMFREKTLIDPQQIVLHAKQPSKLPLLQLKYDRLMAAADSDTAELQALKQAIDKLK